MAVSKIELGEYNFVVAMTIAVIKGSLVVWFFMDVRRSQFVDQAVRRRRILLDGDSARIRAERLPQPGMGSQAGLLESLFQIRDDIFRGLDARR